MLDRFSTAFLLFGLGTLAAAVAFVIWFTMAYRNISIWATTRRARYWPVFAWFVPFINLIRPMSMMLELVEHSPREDRRGELSPTPAILWWFLWILPGVAGGLVGILVISRDLSRIGETIFMIQDFVTVLNAASVLLAIYLVQVITDSQDHRKAR